MRDKDIARILNRVNAEGNSGEGFDAAKACKAVAQRIGYDTECKQPRYSYRDFLEYYMWDFTHVLLRPLAASVSVFVFAIIGWVSVANASISALPGEKLYPIKLSVEKAQLALAFGAGERANLKVEFASRRLEEMVKVASTQYRIAPDSVSVAVERFKNEVTTIKQELQEADEPEEKQTELAMAVGRKVESYATTVALTGNELAPEVKTQVEAVIEEAKEQAVEVIITANEQAQDEETLHELEIAFQKELESVQTQCGAQADEAVNKAEALRDEGNYRRAFQVLKEIKMGGLE
jgi:hypothetical protein